MNCENCPFYQYWDTDTLEPDCYNNGNCPD